MGDSTLKSAWRRQKEWSETANQLKASISFWRKAVLFLAVAASVFGTWSGYFQVDSDGHLLTSALAAVAAGVAPVIVQLRLGKSNIEQWIRARSASEAYKAEIFQYRTRARSRGEDNRNGNLSEAMRKISQSVNDIPSVGPRETSISDEMLDDLSIAEYVDRRVKQQIQDYYRPKAQHHAQIADRYRSVHFALMVVGAALGGVSAVANVGVGSWIAVVTTVAASVSAYNEAGRHDYLAISFRATANRLEEIINPWLDTAQKQPSPQDIDELVAECENVISIEDQSWHAKFGAGPANVAVH